MSRTEPPPTAYAETTPPVAFSVNIIVPVTGFEGSRFIKAGEPSPYCDISEVPEQLKSFIAGDETAESQGPPGGLFELSTIYNVSPGRDTFASRPTRGRSTSRRGLVAGAN